MTRRSIGFAIQWAVATTIGVALAHLAADLIWFSVRSRWLFPFVPFGGATLGISAGMLQWFVLRQRVPRSAAWMLATAVGWAGAWAVGSTAALVIAASGGNMLFFVSMACGTPVIGLAQRHFLREWTSRADSWLVPSAIGWTALLAIEVFVPGLLSAISDRASRLVETVSGYSPSSTVGASVAGGLLLGAISGVAMAWLLESPGKTRMASLRT